MQSAIVVSELTSDDNSSLNELEPYLLFSLLFFLGLIFFKLITGNSKTSAPLHLQPGFAKMRSEKSRSESIIDLGKLQNSTVTTKEAGSENGRYDVALHQFNIRIKEEISKRENLDPFSVIEDMKRMNLKPDITTFNTLLDICFEKNQQDIAFSFFTYMKNLDRDQINHSSFQVDVISYNTMIKGLCLQISDRNEEEDNDLILKRLLTILEELQNSSIHPNEITFNTVLDACVKAGEMDLAFQFFDEMRESGLQPDNFTYATMIKGIKNHQIGSQKDYKETGSKHRKIKMSNSENSSLDKVFEILTSCNQGKYVKPDEILFNCVMDACIKFKNLPKAVEVYNEMINMELQPSSITYGILIKGFGNEKQFDGVMKMCDNMMRERIRINEATYGCLIDACIKCEKIDKAMDFFKMMREDYDTKINSVIYSLLIKGFTTVRRFEKAYEVFLCMHNNPNIQPNIITYNAMLECAIKCNNPKFFDIYDDIMKINDENFKPDLITFSTYIKGLCKFNRVADAFVMYNKLKKERSFSLDEVLFNSLLHGLQKAKEYEKAIQIYKDMQANNIRPSNITYSILIKIHSDQYQIDEALRVFEDVRSQGVPGLILYTCIVQACIRCKKIPKMLEYFNEMRVNRIECDEVLYNTIISGLTFNYHLKDAVDVLFETFVKRKYLNHEVYFNVLKNLYKKINARYAMKGDLSQEEYEQFITKIFEKLDELRIVLDKNVLKEIQTKGFDDYETERRSSDNLGRKRTYTNNNSGSKYQHVHRRTMY